MAKQLLFDDAARLRAYEGVKELANAVRVTLGPSGRNVLLDKKFGKPQSTRDGVTVSKEVELPEPFENLGAKLVNSAADKTNDIAGDGTTTAILLAEALIREGLKALAAGVNPVALRRGMEKATDAALSDLAARARPVEGEKDYRQVALVASHYEPEIADVVTQAILKVGKEGVITVEEGKAMKTELEFVGGLQFDKGFVSPYFITHTQDLVAELEETYVLLTDKKISAVADIVPILEKVAQTGRPILVVAEEVEGEALAALVVNKLRGILRACAVKAPAFGDRRKAMLQDMAVLTGGQVVSDDLGLTLEKLQMEHLGRAQRVRVEKEKTTIIGGAGAKEDVQRRMAEIRTLISRTTSDYDREKLEERLAKISGGVAVVKVGGTTETDIKERKFRVDDAVHAVKAAALEGTLPGGGVAYLRAVPAIEKLALSDDERAGARVVARALEEPILQIAKNAGEDAPYILHEVKRRSGSEGFDAQSGQFGDLIALGVLDAAKVARTALLNAQSVAALLLTSRTLIVELPEKKKAAVGATR